MSEFYDLLRKKRNLVAEAFALAEAAHRGQVRKYSFRPYIAHPVSVSLAVQRHFADRCDGFKHILIADFHEEMAAAALLHDVIEDCGVTYQDLNAHLGKNVADLVAWLTNPTKGSQLPRADRKKQDRDHIARAPWTAKLIKIYDRTDNLLEIDPADDFVKLYLDESEALLEVLITDETFSAAKHLGLVISGLRQKVSK